MRATIGALWLWLCLCAVHPSTAYASSQKILQQSFSEAQEALALGRWALFAKAVDRMELLFAKHEESLRPAEREQFRLWLYRFQFKRHQHKGQLPPIQRIEQFASLEELSAYLQRFERAIEDLKPTLSYLRLYNRAFSRLAKTQGWRSQLALQSSLSIERDYELLFRQSQIYVSFLAFAKQNWKEKTLISQRFQSQDSDISQLRERQKKMLRAEEARYAKQKREALAVDSAHQWFVEKQKKDALAFRRSGTFLIVGGSMLAGGALLSVLGGLLLHDLGASRPMNAGTCDRFATGAERSLCREQAGFVSPILPPSSEDKSWKESLSWGAPTTLTLGILVGTVGASLLLYGLLSKPASWAGMRNVLQSQEKFFEGMPSEEGSVSSNMDIQKQKCSLLGIYR